MNVAGRNSYCLQAKLARVREVEKDVERDVVRNGVRDGVRDGYEGRRMTSNDSKEVSGENESGENVVLAAS